MTSSTLSNTTLILSGPTDWDEWYLVIVQAAESNHIKDLIDVDSAVSPVLQRPTRPAAKDVNPEKETFATLTPAEREDWKYLMEGYKEDKATFDQKEKALIEIKNHIFRTINRTLIMSLQDITSVHKILRTLKQLVAPTDRAKKISVQTRWRSLMSSVAKQNLDHWTLQVERTYQDAKKLNLPEAYEEAPVDSFLAAIDSVDPYYAAAQKALLQKAMRVDPKSVSMSDLLEDFRHHMREKTAQKTSKNAHNAFSTTSPTFQDQQQGQHQQSDQKRPCLCGMQHRFSKCYYLMPSLRPESWKEDPKTREEIDAKIKKSWKLKQIIKKLENENDKQPDETKNSKNDKQASTAGAFLTRISLMSTELEEVALKASWILDSGADVHVCNDPERFRRTRDAPVGNRLRMGRGSYPIDAYGSVDIKVQTLEGVRTITLSEVALAPGFATNLVSMSRLNAKGVYWDQRACCLRRDELFFCTLHQKGSLWEVEDPSTRPSDTTKHAFATRSSKPRLLKQGDASKWHAILGHPGQEALTHLQGSTEGVDMKEGPAGPLTIECEACSLSKAHRVVSRRPDHEEDASKPLERVGFDLIAMPEAYNGHRWISHFVCFQTRMDFVYTHASKSSSTSIVEDFVHLASTRYKRTVRYIRTDGETSLGQQFDQFIASKGISIEKSAPYTPAQNGSAERAGKAIITRARTIRIASSLPNSLWPEVVKAAAYLGNRTPCRQLTWKTPWECLHDKKPSLAHLSVYGCRAYPLQHNVPRLQKLDPRSIIGYLVGYASTNLFQIWVPSQQKVIVTRDVTFNETLFYDPGELDLGHLLQDLQPIIETIELPVIQLAESQQEDEDIGDTIIVQPSENSIYDDLPQIQLPTPEATPACTATPSQVSPPRIDSPGPTTASPATGVQSSTGGTTTVSADIDEGNIVLGARSRKQTRRNAYLATLKDSTPEVHYHNAFATGLQKDESILKLHISTVPKEPRTWKEMTNHRFAVEFKEAAKAEIAELQARETFEHASADVYTGDPLPLTWVFKYKVDAEGFIERFKARICVRGDLQHTYEDTYAATLAAQTFRTIMSITAAFDLETRQYDAVGAFLNATLDEPTFVRCPEGFGIPGKIWILKKALYGLKQSPRLWYRALTNVLEEGLGLTAVPGVECLFVDSKCILFFFVDDIVAVCRREHLQHLVNLEDRLSNRFKVRCLGELSWFLGIRITRDREEGVLALCQDSYISKVAAKFKITEHTRVHCPPWIPDASPKVSEASDAPDIPDPQLIYAYQQRVGSINFAAIITRPDVAFAASKLAQHNQKPSSEMLKKADETIAYLYQTRYLAIAYNAYKQDSVLAISSDAAFADDVDSRRSSDGYLFQLFGGPIHWKANKQKTVTTSSTEAELLAISTAAKEAIWWNRFFEAIKFNPGHRLEIQCDNKQTIRALEQEKINTKLRHVDIHRHWMRQEVRKGIIIIRWTPTADMIADGLTKHLPRQRHEAFRRQLGLEELTCLQDHDSTRVDRTKEADSLHSKQSGGVC